MSRSKKAIFIKKRVPSKSTKKINIEINKDDVLVSAKKLEKSVLKSKDTDKPITFIEME